MDILKVDKRMAIYYLYVLRKDGYVKTRRQSNNRRVYNISLDNKLGVKVTMILLTDILRLRFPRQ